MTIRRIAATSQLSSRTPRTPGRRSRDSAHAFDQEARRCAARTPSPASGSRRRPGSPASAHRRPAWNSSSARWPGSNASHPEWSSAAARRARKRRDESEIRSIAVLGDRRNLSGFRRTFTAGCAELCTREYERFDCGSRRDDLRPGQRAVTVLVQLQRLMQIADVEVPFGVNVDSPSARKARKLLPDVCANAPT